jgi:hypothetical protein
MRSQLPGLNPPSYSETAGDDANQPHPALRSRARADPSRPGEKSLEVAELVAGEQEIPESRSVAAALSVLSGIAASDAACCAALGRRSRGDDHRQAAALLREIVDGDRAAKALLDLLNLKDTAQYGLIPITQRELTTALRRAKHLLDFAGDVLRR